MAKQKSALLQPHPDQDDRPYEVRIRLQEGRTAVFTYSDRQMARDHYDALRAIGVLGGYAIRHAEYHDSTRS